MTNLAKTNDFFPPRPVATPTIYAFASTHPDHAELLKVGNTSRAAGERRDDIAPVVTDQDGIAGHGSCDKDLAKVKPPERDVWRSA